MMKQTNPDTRTGADRKGGGKQRMTPEAFQKQQEERRQKRIQRAGEPDTQVISAKTAATRNIINIADQCDRGVAMLLDRMSSGRVPLSTAVALLEGLQEATNRLSATAGLILKEVGSYYRPPRAIIEPAKTRT
jgi:hypothetical protein